MVSAILAYRALSSLRYNMRFDGWTMAHVQYNILLYFVSKVNSLFIRSGHDTHVKSSLLIFGPFMQQNKVLLLHNIAQ